MFNRWDGFEMFEFNFSEEQEKAVRKVLEKINSLEDDSFSTFEID